jgi:hypothetical protein
MDLKHRFKTSIENIDLKHRTITFYLNWRPSTRPQFDRNFSPRRPSSSLQNLLPATARYPNKNRHLGLDTIFFALAIAI